MKRVNGVGIVTAAVLLFSLLAQQAAHAQQNGPGQGGFQGQGQGNFQNGPPDPSQIRSMITNRYKDALEATDEEWAIIGPKVDKIQSLQTDLGGGPLGAIGMLARGFQGMGRGGGQGGGNRFGGGGGGGGNRGFDVSALLGPETPLRRKMQLLSDALNNKDTPQSQIKQLLASIRDDRERARAELTKARQDLIELLTPRQEGVLFQMGLLE